MRHGWKRRFARTATVYGTLAALCGTMVMPAQADGLSAGSGAAPAAPLPAAPEDLLLHYTFDGEGDAAWKDASGHGNDGTLHGGAARNAYGKTGGALDLNGTDGYLQLPDGLLADQHNVTVAAWVNADTLGAWSRVFDFGTSNTNYMFLSLRDHEGNSRFGVRPDGSGESTLIGPAFPNSKSWQHVAAVIDGNTYTLYMNGIQVASVSNVQVDPSELGPTNRNYLGKSQFSADPYFDGRIDDFRIYGRALSETELVGIATGGMSDAEMLAYDKNWLNLGDTSEQTKDLTLPRTGVAGSTIAWVSSNPEVVGTDGKVTRPQTGEGDKTVTLTATLSNGAAQDTKTFTVIVTEAGSAAYSLEIDGKNAAHAVSPTLYGIFYEDINYAADGGLYGDLIENRSFEFGTPLFAWTKKTLGGGDGQLTTATEAPLNANNPRYARITVAEPGTGVGVSNAGYSGGIAVKAGENYDFTVYARSAGTLTKPIIATLRGADQAVLGSCEASGIADEWKKIGCSITASAASANASFDVTAAEKATIDLDMISLFPEKTWHNRANGLRYDLAEMLDDLSPNFLRFPGGCIVEGGSLENRYRWKNTIGDVAQRQVQPNQWAANYYQSFGLGFHEYFQLAEDIGAEPLPIIFIGQVSCHSNPPKVPMDQLGPYIQDALDLIEYANGDATTEWGAKRAANGHPEPFNMKYLGVGNELWGQDYLDRYNVFYDAIKAKYPDMQLVLSAGYSPSDENFRKAYEWLKNNGNKADLVDEHMYQSPDWFYNNVNRYDNYSRTGPKVFVGEYAAHGVGKKNNMESALAEAAFMTGLERNSDVVGMASFAPLFARQSNTQWTTDLIWFNNAQSYATPNYYVQQLFGNHIGQEVMPTNLTRKKASANDIAGSIVLGSWNTAVEYDEIKVAKADGTELYAENFGDDAAIEKWSALQGNWSVIGGSVKQSSQTTTDARLALKTGADWSNYTVTMKARKTSGSEGFLVGFGAKDANNYYWWNLGGWNNTQTVVEKATNGQKAIVGNTVAGGVETNRWYELKIEVQGSGIRAYLDGKLVNEVQPAQGPLYSVTTKDAATGDLIVKTVNASGNAQSANVSVDANYINPKATVIELKADALTAENSFSQPDAVRPQTRVESGFGKSFTYEYPAYSVTVLRLKTTPSALIESVTPIELATAKGTLPELPAKVEVAVNGGTKQANVAWNSLDEEQVAKTGTFRIRGAVEGTYLQAEALVRVTDAPSGQDGASLTGPASAQEAELVDVVYSLSGLAEAVYANDVTIVYDPSQLEFRSAEALSDQMQVVGQTEPGDSGQIRMLLASTDPAGVDASGTEALLKLKFAVRPVAQQSIAFIALRDVMTADADGKETLTAASAPLRIQLRHADAPADKTELNNLIASAQSLHDAAVEGAKPGEYRAGAKAALQQAIADARTIAANGSATARQVKEATKRLQAALQTFKDAVVPVQQGDINEDGKYSIGDLSIAAAHYGKSSADSNWNSIKKSDVTGDGRIDIEDLARIARWILG
ncbi:LamG-like jellyroll fold domain-containing protein [Paenibacillus methanolicus]|uniref:non-reducing end alpha-L-arabinofuranosidase n=1 Tax=Paenibacillus methanolicus TaxID=582686 RepID=A0A5S5CJH2_9BACL|nr:LamG-like jellyroll fold domain-containing protein [Paenibacillus methanolicus]TYP79842.1 alpha-L-arabinofuranosidase [Paenibacillus methanolicus]